MGVAESLVVAGVIEGVRVAVVVVLSEGTAEGEREYVGNAV